MSGINRIVIIGFGTVARCVVDILRGENDFPSGRLSIYSAEERDAEISAICGNEIHYETLKLTREHYEMQLASRLEEGDLLVNLAVSVDSQDLAEWCLSNGVRYMDTAFEPWDDDIFEVALPPKQRTVAWYQAEARRRFDQHRGTPSPTCLFSHGANPGLISHIARRCILKMAEEKHGVADAIYRREDWIRCARSVDARTILLTERDTQHSTRIRAPGEFHNTWCPIGFIEEASRPAELYIGSTHSRVPHSLNLKPVLDSPSGAAFLEQSSLMTPFRGWVPRGGPILGMLFPHSECFTLGDYFHDEVWDLSVMYSYLPCDAALCSLHEVAMNDWQLPESCHVMTSDIIAGADELGAMVMTDGGEAFWYGSYLDIDSARSLVNERHNATAVQVAAGVLAGIRWIQANPTVGFVECEDLPAVETLDSVEKYLGSLDFVRCDWTPAKREVDLFSRLPTLDRESLDAFLP